MTDFVKRLMRFYYAHSQAYSLITLPINGLGALSSFLVLFTLVSGIKFAGWVYVVLFVFSTVILFLLGSAAKKMGLLRYWQSLSNSQNAELMDILKKVQGK